MYSDKWWGGGGLGEYGKGWVGEHEVKDFFNKY